MTAGFVALLVALAAATAFGLHRRRRDGRLAAPGPRGARPWAARRRWGASARSGAAGAVAGGRGVRLGAAQLGQPLGERATLLQFSSEFCAPCRATRAVLAEVARATDGVRHVEVDAAQRLDLARLLDVRRTPTVFVLGPDGRVARRGSGLMRQADVQAAVAEAGGAA